MFHIFLISNVLALQSYTECSADQYYNTATGLCSSCPTSTTRYNISLCVCDNTQGFYRSSDTIMGFQYESLCNSIGSNCTSGEVNLKYSYNGETLTSTSTLACTSCNSNAYSDPLRESCIPCQDKQMNYTGSCECSSGYTKSYDTCINDTLLTITGISFTNDAQITYDTTTQNSAYLLQIYQYAYTTCYYSGNVNSCQMLANLCAIQLYILTKGICQLFTTTTLRSATYAPQLIPQQSSDLYQTLFSQTMKLDNSDSKNRRHLNYTMKKFDRDGNLISNTYLRSELILCPHTPEDEINSMLFGLNMHISCELDLTAFLQEEMYFYELQVTPVRDDNTISPQQVYVLIADLTDLNGNQPNTDKPSSNSQFVTRFFMVDTISAKDDVTSISEVPSFIRYASKLKIMMIPSSDSYEKIYVPYLYIEYSTQQAQGSSFSKASFTFEVQISPDPSTFWTVIMILFIIMNVLIGIWWLIRIWVWTKTNPIKSHSFYIWQLFKAMLKTLIDSWTDWMFFFLWLVTAYWFCFFKFQNTPFLLMLDQNDSSNYQPFYGLFYCMFVLRMFHVLWLIYQQSNISIYFIDWEKTEIHRPHEVEEMEELQSAATKIKGKVSIWRTLLVANEFNELSVIRTISVEWTLIIVGFFLMQQYYFLQKKQSGLNFQKRFSESPDLIETQSHVPDNPVLKYFLVQFVYLCVGLVQLILRRIFNIWVPYPYEDFVDLCTIANVSIFILDDHLHGYYIHGENPMGFSEGGIPHLQACLRNEAKNKGKNRGLVREGYDSELCTYELYVPPEFKEKFEANYSQNYKEKRDIRQLGIEHIELQKFKIEQFLKFKIDSIKHNDKQYIRNKEIAQRYLDYPPDELATDEFNKQSIPYFYKDPDFSYRKIFFSGYEMNFLITDILIFTFWIMITNNVALSILLQYFCTKALEWIKQEWQRDNISEKTKIDKRFLI